MTGGGSGPYAIALRHRPFPDALRHRPTPEPHGHRRTPESLGDRPPLDSAGRPRTPWRRERRSAVSGARPPAQDSSK